MSNKQTDKYYENLIENLTDQDLYDLYDYIEDQAIESAWETEDMMRNYDDVDLACEIAWELFSENPQKFLTKEILDQHFNNRIKTELA